jgi:glycosyltransferase involved in cell wall biosynthesis
VPAAKIALVRHGVAAATPAAPEERAARRRELGIPESAVVAASFLRLHPQKRPLDLVEVARRTAGDGVWLLLVGGGPLDAELRADLARRPAPNVVWRPLDPEPERLFAAADLCLMASEYEGLPIFLLEGMSRGLPAVATAAGEIPELLAGGAGRLAAPGDVDALAAGVRELLDPAARRSAGDVARRAAAERFSLERFVAETDAAIFGTGAEALRGPGDTS